MQMDVKELEMVVLSNQQSQSLPINRKTPGINGFIALMIIRKRCTLLHGAHAARKQEPE